MRESGMTRRQIVEEFVKAGVDEENAKDLVKTVLTSQRRAQSNAGSGVPGIVWYIGILLLINVLSFVFDLGFIVY